MNYPSQYNSSLTFTTLRSGQATRRASRRVLLPAPIFPSIDINKGRCILDSFDSDTML